jgi:hypothetical protein
MHEDYNDVLEQTQADIALFAIVFSVIQECDGVALKDSMRIAKVKSVLSKIRPTFAFIPEEFHTRTS